MYVRVQAAWRAVPWSSHPGPGALLRTFSKQSCSWRGTLHRVRSIPPDELRDLKLFLEEAVKLEPVELKELDWNDVGEEEPSTVEIKQDSANLGRKRRGRKKGVPLDEAHSLAIKVGSKGKNKYVRTPMHRWRVSQSLKKSWVRRRKAGLSKIVHHCSICGEAGHNKSTCSTSAELNEQQQPGTLASSVNSRDGPKIDDGRKTAEKRQKRTFRCSHCKELGHTKRSCPELKRIQALAKADVTLEKQGNLDMPAETKEENDRITSTVPVEVGPIWRVALDSILHAFRNGVNRQRMEFTFPVVRDGVSLDPMLSSKSDMSQQFRVGFLIVEALLKEIKTEPGLEGSIEVEVLDEEEGTIYWEGKQTIAILFPQPQTLDVMISRGMMRRTKAPKLQLLINPQWQPGQIVSDFGFGQLRELRENYVDSFEDVFYMKQISVFSDTVIVMRCYPRPWEVHLVEPDGSITMVGTSDNPPEFEEVVVMLRTAESSLSRLNWVERLRAKYIQRRKRISPFPLSLSKAELEECFEADGLSVSEKLNALHKATNPSLVHPSRQRKLPQEDIISGELIQGIDLDSSTDSGDEV